MRNIFSHRVFLELSLGERIAHSLAVTTLPLTILAYFLVEHEIDEPLVRIVISLFGAIVGGVATAFLEHWVVRFIPKEKTDT